MAISRLDEIRRAGALGLTHISYDPVRDLFRCKCGAEFNDRIRPMSELTAWRAEHAECAIPIDDSWIRLAEGSFPPAPPSRFDIPGHLERPPYATCKGSYALGTACNECERCRRELAEIERRKFNGQDKSATGSAMGFFLSRNPL